MNFVKKKASNSGVGSRQTKSVTVYYFYKTDIDDKMDEEILLARALDAINENEEFNIIKYIGFIWFGISAQCSTCIYLGLEDDDPSLDASTFLKLIDSHMWKLNAGYMYIENNYTKIIITGCKPPDQLFTSSSKWKAALKNFKIEKVD